LQGPPSALKEQEGLQARSRRNTDPEALSINNGSFSGQSVPRGIKDEGSRFDALPMWDRKPLDHSTKSKTPEEFATEDLEEFWRWCPVPLDGLHRCALLVKLFDYLGLTAKEDKLWWKVKRLDVALHELDVMETQDISKDQRVSRESFMNEKFRNAIVSMLRDCRHEDVIEDVKQLLAQRQRTAKCFTSPLRLWVKTATITPSADV